MVSKYLGWRYEDGEVGIGREGNGDLIRKSVWGGRKNLGFLEHGS